MTKRDAVTIHEGHPAVNVKVQRLDTPDGYTDADRDRAWDMTVEQFWEIDAHNAACKRGYDGVHSQGRSGGWCVPFYQDRQSYRYPDVAHNGADRERFRAFQRDIRRLLAEVQEEYVANLAQAKESREEYAVESYGS